MEIRRRNDAIEISELDPFLAELLRQIPASANPDGVPGGQNNASSVHHQMENKQNCARVEDICRTRAAASLSDGDRDGGGQICSN